MKPTPRSHRPWVIMLASLGLALAVRLIYLAAFRGSPYFDGFMAAAAWQPDWSLAWADGVWVMDGSLFRAPLYPLWLSQWYGVLGDNLMAMRGVQMMVGAGTAAAMAGCGLRLGGSRTGWVAGILAAIYGPLVFFDGELLAPNLLLALLSWGLFFLLGRGRGLDLILSAAFLGLAAVARPNAVVLLPVAAVFLYRNRPVAGRTALITAAMLAILPAMLVTAMNIRGEGTQGGINLYAGNHTGATGRTVAIPELGGRDAGWADFVMQARRFAEQESGAELSAEQVSRFWASRAGTWVLDHPRDALALTSRKAYYLINGYEVPDHRDLYTDRPGILKGLLWSIPWMAFPWGLVFPLAMAGIALGCRDESTRRRTWLLLVWVAIYALSLVPFFIAARFRLGILPALIPLAAFALVRVRTWSAVPIAVFVIAFFLSNSMLFDARAHDPSQELVNRGAGLLARQDVDQAIIVLGQARAADPSARNTYLLGRALLAAGRNDEARDRMLEAWALKPVGAELQFQIGESLWRLGQWNEAVAAMELAAPSLGQDSVFMESFAHALWDADRTEEGIAILTHAVDLRPGDEALRVDLGGMLVKAGRIEEAFGVWTEGLALFPDSYDFHYNLAVVYGQRGDFSTAADHATRAVLIRPGDEAAQKLMDWLRTKGR